MTKPDRSNAELPSDGAVLLKRALLGIGGGVTLVFLAGVIAGYTGVVLEKDEPDLRDMVVLAVMTLAALATGYVVWRFWPRGNNEPEAPRVRSARMILIAACAVSAPFGALLGMSDSEATGLFSNGPISPVIALLAIVVWIILVPLLTWLWWQRVDEHEASAYRDGAFISLHAYMFITPTWWLASRAGWLPQQEPMLVLLAVCIVWSIVSIVRKYF
jgi:hypothetical protein